MPLTKPLPFSHRIGFGAFCALALACGVLVTQAPASQASAMSEAIADTASLTDAELACAAPLAVQDLRKATMPRPGPMPTIAEARASAIETAIAACT